MHAFAVYVDMATRCVHRKCVLFPARIQLRCLEIAALCVQVWRLIERYIIEQSTAFWDVTPCYFGRWVRMEIAGSTELLVSVYQTTQCYISLDSRLNLTAMCDSQGCWTSELCFVI